MTKVVAAKSKPGADTPEHEGARSGIQVIARAANILRSLEGEHEGLSLSDISERVDLPRSTVQRIVAALAEERLLWTATPRSKVKLGPALIRLAKSADSDLSNVVKPFIEDLSRQIDETVDLSILQGNEVVFVDQVLGNRRLRAVSSVGDRFPLHCTANGKALLATLPDGKLRKLLNSELSRQTPNTQTKPEAIKDEIDRIRATGISYDLEEHTEGVCAIGTSIEVFPGRQMAISIPIPTARFASSRSRIETLLLKCKQQILEKSGTT